MFHISCGIHTSQLILADLERENKDFVRFKAEVQGLLKHFKQKTLEAALRSLGVKGKIPLIQEIKWTTFCGACRFIDENRSSSTNTSDKRQE